MTDQRQFDFNGPVHTGRNHPDTSRRAAHKLAGEKVRKLRKEVLKVVQEAGGRGITAAEVTQVMDKDKNSTSPRVTELRQGGLIYDSGWRRKTPPVGSSIIWLADGVEPGEEIIFDTEAKRK